VARRRDPFLGLVAALRRRRTRFVLIGVAGANYWARSGAAIFSTEDFDLLLPADAGQLLRAWRACEAQGLELWLGDEPLDRPRNLTLAETVCERRALVRASGRDLTVDLTLVMSGFSFEDVWAERREFVVNAVRVPVARLRQIVESKARTGRAKDRLFLAAHEEALRELIGPAEPRRRAVGRKRRRR